MPEEGLSLEMLRQFMLVREPPSLPVPPRDYSARDWFACLFSQKKGLAEESQGVANPNINLLGYLLSNRTIFISANDKVGLDKETILNLVMREVVAERTTKVPQQDTGLAELVFQYSTQVAQDLGFFQGLYLGTLSREDLLAKMHFQPSTSPVIAPELYAGPPAYAAADSLLSYLPMLNLPNPAVASIADLRYLIGANIIRNLTKSPTLKTRIRTEFLRPDVNAQTKLIYAGLLFYQGFINYIAGHVQGFKG
jgi:hypothetical protein